jgi:hypothetical protein
MALFLFGLYLWYMSTKIKITERQYSLLQNHLMESNYHQHMVERLVKDLDMNYEPMLGIMRENGEYIESPMIKIKVDESEITPKDLFEYFKKKYELGDKFIQQVIKDWMFGGIDKNQLSKNVPIS